MPGPVQLTRSNIVRNTPIYRIPRIIAFNRLEARPRALDFTRSLRAEVRDPLWLLTRQWQFGEFQGEDAASPVTARIAYQHEQITQVAFPGGAAFDYHADSLPLETRVERESIPLAETRQGLVFSDMLLAVQWGKQLLRMLQTAGLAAHYPLYIQAFPIRVLPPEPPPPGVRMVQDPDAEQIQAAAAARVADGVAIWRAVESGAHDTWLDALPGPAALKPVAKAFAAGCRAKYERLFTQPEPTLPPAPPDTAWRPEHLEYAFSVRGAARADGAQTELLADQYHQGHLDWYSFDAATRRESPPDPPPPALEAVVESFLPAQVRFRGQPQPRFWEMEETQTDFGKIDTSPTGLLHLLLAEFGLIYSNDWFLLPHPMPANAVCEIRGILVDDTFGRHTFLRPAGRGPETQWQRWAMFHQTERSAGRTAANRFYLVPTVGKVLESEAIERVNFLRDEMANMVWAVESILPSQLGMGMRGAAVSPSGPSTPLISEAADVKIRYSLGTRVPENWIPFIPIHAPGSVSEIRLQRARMVGGQPPRSRLLREPGSPYFVEEEEVPRAGIYVERSWQRARWLGGRTFVWVGRRKTAGRGEGWSQLAFDQILDLQPKAGEA